MLLLKYDFYLGEILLKLLNIQHPIIFVSILAVLSAAILLTIFFAASRVNFTAEKFFESNKLFRNPYCGFYHIMGYTLSDDYIPTDSLPYEVTSYAESLVLLEINLKNYRKAQISEKGLEQLEDIFYVWKHSPSKAKIILRFLYDWDGIALKTEPDSLKLVLKHMEQVSQTVNKYHDTVYIMQGIFIGNWGEMHNSRFSDQNSVKILTNHLNELIYPSIYLSVRTPKQWRTANASHQPKSNTRIGLFNDGILGSESDLGTYAENERKKELEFQNKLCQFVPNGGEVVYNNNLSELETSVSALKEMHISYLNTDYDSRVLEKWENSHWKGEGIFNGCNGYTYIKAHLGYRFFIDSCEIKKSGIINPIYILYLTVKNSGFSNALKPFKIDVVLLNEETKECIFVPFDADLRTVESENKKTFTLRLPVKEIKQGEYLVYFSVRDKSSGQTIFLGNQNNITDKGYLLGRLKK